MTRSDAAWVAAVPRFWSKVDMAGPGGCWLWRAGKTRGGYGMTSILHWTRVYAHRFAYEELRGPIPKGLCIDHLCRVRACVNPMHMEVVTTGVNTLRGESPMAKFAGATACHRGHPYDEANTVRYQGTRHCRTCINDGQRRRARGLPGAPRHWTQAPAASQGGGA